MREENVKQGAIVGFQEVEKAGYSALVLKSLGITGYATNNNSYGNSFYRFSTKNVYTTLNIFNNN